MNNFWNDRYSTEEYVYGVEPNKFVKENLDKLSPGEILFPAEGEGRNAVYAAKRDWKVTAFDPSIEGKKKALLLAEKNGVKIDYLIDSYETVSFEEERFDCIVLVFAHMHPLKRREYHQKLAKFLKPGGKLILEGFSKKQIENNSGGPRDIDMLFSEKELAEDFSSLSEVQITETDTNLDEGSFHQGKASVIRLTGTK